jgi:hypothetical protein
MHKIKVVLNEDKEFDVYFQKEGVWEYATTATTKKEALDEGEKYIANLEGIRMAEYNEAVEKSIKKRGNPNWKPYKKLIQITTRK